VRDVDLAELGLVVLVGHSIGGVTVAAVAELLGTRVQRCIFVSSPMPAEGQRIVDAVNPILRWFCMRAIRQGCRDLTLPPPIARLVFCNDMSRIICAPTALARELAWLVTSPASDE
jgi:pimeloyl-ACP methyl ester carboxylesterase